MDDIRRVKPTPNKPNPESPNLPDPVEPTSLTPPEPLHKKSRKKLVISIMIILLTAVAAGAYFFFFKDAKEESVTTQSTTSETTASEEYPERFYITKRPDTVVVYNPVTKSSETFKLDLSGERALVTTNIGSNQPIVLSSDGSKIMYSSVTYASDADLAEIESTNLSVFTDNKETKLVTYKNDEGKGLIDWTMTPDGARIYYVVSGQKEGSNPAKSDLYTMTISDKKSKLIKSDIYANGDSQAPLFMDKDGTMRFYTANSGQLTEHKVVTDTITSRAIGSLACGTNTGLEYPRALSPDNKQLLLEAGGSDDEGNFTYCQMELASGKNSVLIKVKPTNEQWVASYWSPDGGRIAHNVSTYGDAPASFKPRIEIFSLDTKKSSILFGEAKSVEEPVDIFGWSPDSRFLAFSHGGKVKMYDFSTNTVLETDLSAEELSSSDAGFGWY